ncbi:hypothetical protein RA276_28050, partial [Pseudomonas syringae pv. tagetis]|uniref:hypothetical protein n=1 Tax=Pseudomonas syringae group genomosp. 7 TaxID=251699 RepID=UPI00376F7290
LLWVGLFLFVWLGWCWGCCGFGLGFLVWVLVVCGLWWFWVWLLVVGVGGVCCVWFWWLFGWCCCWVLGWLGCFCVLCCGGGGILLWGCWCMWGGAWFLCW